MANLTKPTLRVELLPAERVNLIVDGTITFRAIDRADMRNGARFILTCDVFGDDATGGKPDSGDENLRVPFEPLRRVFTGEQPEQVPFKFSAKNVDKAALNEDGLLDDEVYAKVRLVNDRTPPTDISSFSNAITGEFAERKVG